MIQLFKSDPCDIEVLESDELVVVAVCQRDVCRNILYVSVEGSHTDPNVFPAACSLRGLHTQLERVLLGVLRENNIAVS